MKIVSKKIYTKIFVIGSLFVLYTNARAQGDTTKKNVTASNNYIDSTAGNTFKEPIVTDVFKEGKEDKSISDRKFAGIGDIIVIRVANADVLLSKSKCKKTDGTDSTPCNPQSVRLFINGRMIGNINPLSGAPQVDTSTGEGEFQYRLERNKDNNEAWTDLLGAPRFGREFFNRQVKVSVGLEDEYPIKVLNNPKSHFDDSNNLLLSRMRLPWFWWCLFGIIAYIILIVWLAKNTDLLRDRGIDVAALFADPADQLRYQYNPLNRIMRPYSLGRFQMAFWFTLVVISFLFIWLINGATDIVTPGVLALIGISAGTSVSALVIDNSKNSEKLNQTLLLRTEAQILPKDIVDLDNMIATKPSNESDLQAQKNVKESRLAVIAPEIDANMKSLVPKASEGFMTDLLSDVNGISFHRLQMFVWTLVLGLLFIYSVWAKLTMPDFDATLLALQGLTAGTYLGFKMPEKQA